MQENRGGAPNFELPAQPRPPETEQGREQAVEAPAARPETSGSQPKQPALPTVPDDIPIADHPLIAAPPVDTAATQSAAKPTMPDTDNIERQWVDKVKNIVAQTQDDPHLQKEQMSRVKAEYIQKRFNKTIKMDDSSDSAHSRPELSRGGEAAG